MKKIGVQKMALKAKKIILLFLIVALSLFLVPREVNANTNAEIGAFVTRFYQLCLSRTPDSGGLSWWVNQLVTRQKTGSDVANGFINSPEFVGNNVSNADFVKIMYRAFFNREPDIGGYNFWLNSLSSGRPRQFVLAGFINSQEFHDLCASYGIASGSANAGAFTQTTIVQKGIVTENTSFVGYVEVSPERLVNMFARFNPAQVNKARRLANYYVQYGRYFNLRADIAWAQMCHETGFLRYNGVAKEEWNNFCGLGVVGTPDVGCRFATEELGVIAHFAHLAWYYFPGPINEYTNQTYDPRYFPGGRFNGDTSIKRLNGSWAVPGTYYASALARLTNEI
jgi:hypothetical protein